MDKGTDIVFCEAVEWCLNSATTAAPAALLHKRIDTIDKLHMIRIKSRALNEHLRMQEGQYDATVESGSWWCCAANACFAASDTANSDVSTVS